MVQAKVGDTVRVHYTGTLEGGTVFDTTTNQEPLEFTIGEGRLIPLFEQAVIGMSPGEMKTIQIGPEDAYGPHREELVAVIDRAHIPPDLEPEVGQQLQITQEDGHVIVVQVIDVTDTHVTLDANHPLAGRALSFAIEMLEIC